MKFRVKRNLGEISLTHHPYTVTRFCNFVSVLTFGSTISANHSHELRSFNVFNPPTLPLHLNTYTSTSMATRKRQRTEEQKAREAARSKRRRMEESAQKKENQQLISTLTERLAALEREAKAGLLREIRLEDIRKQQAEKQERERLEAERREKEWEMERAKLKEALDQKERELKMERYLWGSRFDEGSFDLWTRKKIACVLYNSSVAASLERGDSLEREGEDASEEAEGREKAVQRVANCMGTFPEVIGTWVTQPLSSGPSGQLITKGVQPVAVSNNIVQQHGWENPALEELEWGEEFLSDEGTELAMDQPPLEGGYLYQ